MTNMIMGPPISRRCCSAPAPTSAWSRPTCSAKMPMPIRRTETIHGSCAFLPPRAGRELLSEEQDIREGRFQKQVAIITGVSALLSGFEAYYSHYKNNFRYAAQWSPIILAPLLAAAAFASVKNRKLACTALPALSAAASADAAVGFFYHARGILRRPGGRKHLLYNIIYGPPIFAPLLFGAAGMLGLLASLLRRREK